MNLRQYEMTVHRTDRQTVTFVVDVDALDADGLLNVAVAHCRPDGWEDARYEKGNLTSEHLEVR
jgi:hypothetical protein